MDALRNIMINIHGANDKADDINLKLAEQEETILRAKEKAQDVQSQVKKAQAYLRYFARQVYTDKILMCLIFLSMIAIVVIIILKIVKKNKATSIQDVITAIKHGNV